MGNEILYTMQNSKGDWGWVQKIINGKAHDEIQGCKYTIETSEAECYFTIEEKEYEFIVKLWDWYHHEEDHEYMEIMDKFIHCLMRKYEQE